MKFAQRVFLIAGVYGLMIMTLLYFMEGRIGREQPPPITHPVYYYGFVGLAWVFQLIFLMIARDPIRYRALMIPAILEKGVYGITVLILYAQHRLYGGPLIGGLIDLLLGSLFFIAYVKTRYA